MATATTELFPWSEAYCIKISLADTQHKKLVDLINDLHRAMITRTGKERLGKILSELVKYTEAHFKAEEGMLQANQYPGLMNQKAEHQRFTTTILDFQGKFERNELGLTIELMEFLKDWLVKHILSVDKEYVPFLHAKGVH